MKRKDMSSLHNVCLFIREATEEDCKRSDAKPGLDMVLCRASDRDTVLAFIDRNEIFDNNGNRFACN